MEFREESMEVLKFFIWIGETVRLIKGSIMMNWNFSGLDSISICNFFLI